MADSLGFSDTFVTRHGESGIGNRESGIGNRESGIGNREWAIGNREWAIGNREWAIGNRHSAIFKRQASSVKPEEGIGNREWGSVRRQASIDDSALSFTLVRSHDPCSHAHCQAHRHGTTYLGYSSLFPSPTTALNSPQSPRSIANHEGQLLTRKRIRELHGRGFSSLTGWQQGLLLVHKTGQDKTRHDRARPDKTRHDKNKTGHDPTRQDKTRQDKTRQDKTRQDKTRQDKTRQGTTIRDTKGHDPTRQRRTTLLNRTLCASGPPAGVTGNQPPTLPSCPTTLCLPSHPLHLVASSHPFERHNPSVMASHVSPTTAAFIPLH